MSSCIINPVASSRRPRLDASNVFMSLGLTNEDSAQSSGVLERKLTDLVTKQLMAVHLSLDLRQVERPEIGRLYQEVIPLFVFVWLLGNGSQERSSYFCYSEQYSPFSNGYVVSEPVICLDTTCLIRCLAFACNQFPSNSTTYHLWTFGELVLRLDR